MDDKIKAFGKFKIGMTAREVSEDMNISYSKILRWKNELKTAEANNEVIDLLDVEQALISEIAEKTKKDLEELGADTDALEGELEIARDKIDKYKLLNEKLNATAIKLTDKIDSMVSTNLEIKELQMLVAALSQLQTSFFSKPTQVAVFPGGSSGEMSDTAVSKFSSMKRD